MWHSCSLNGSQLETNDAARVTLNYGPSGSTARYEHLGKAAARLDDVLNFLPARLGVVVLCWVAGRRWRAAWSTWRQDGGRTASPNAGQTTACAAGALSVRLENDGHYVLSGGSRLPDASAIADARQLITRALWMGAALAAVIRLTIGD